MDGTDKIFLSLMGLLAGSVCFLFFLLFMSGINTDYRVAEMVANGAHPIAARCALTESEDDLCEVYVGKMETK